MHAIRTLVLLIVAGASIAKPLARHARHSGTHHPQKVHPIPVAHGKSKATRQDRGQPAAGQRQCQPLVKNGEISPAASMVDPTIKLLLMSSPKAGATLVERLMLARVNLTGAAVHFKGYPLRYSHEVFQQAKGRLPTPGHLASCAPGTGWLCVAIVRNPLDRAISSYIHTLLYWKSLGAPFHELDGNANASFAEFAAALDRRARKKASHSPGDGHFMPQSVPTKTGALRPGVLYVPIEMLTEPGGYACHSLARVRGTGLKAAEAAAQGDNSQHYITKATSSPPGSEHWSFAKVRSAKKAPNYDSFWNNTAFCRKVVGCLYRADVEMYVSACRAPALETCAAFRSACEVQLGRLRDVCGLDV